MKILHVSALSKGGAALAAINLHKALLANGVESKMLLAEPVDNLPETYFFAQYIRTVPFLKKLAYRFQDKFRRLFRTFFRKGFEKDFGKLQYLNNSPDFTMHPLYQWADIVHLHWVQGFINWGRLFRTDSKKIVWTLHDMAPFAGGYYYESDKRPRESFDKWSKILGKRKQSFLKPVGNRLTVVCPSIWMRSKSETSKAFASLRHEIIPNCIDTNVFRYGDRQETLAWLNIKVFEPVLLFVASTISDPRKGLKLLFDALNFLPSELQCVIVGDSKSFTEERINQRIFLTGPVNNLESLAACYRLADVYICPSVEDNLPNTVLESLCCGTPVAGFRIGGMPDAVRDGENGYLSDEVTPSGLANAIERVLKMTFDRREIAAKSTERFSYGPIAQLYLSAYRRLVNPEAHERSKQ